MKKIIVGFIAVSIALSMSACQALNSTVTESESVQEETKAETQPYSYEGITLDFPVGYTFTTLDDGSVMAQFGEKQNVTQVITFGKFDGKSEPMTQEAIQNSFMENLKKNADSISEMKDFTEYQVDGYVAQTFRYDYTQKGVTINYIQDNVYLDDKVVWISLGATNSNDFSAVEKIHNSLRVKG